MKLIWYYKKENHITVKLQTQGQTYSGMMWRKSLKLTEINEMEKTKKIVSNRHSVCLCVLVYVCMCALSVYEEKEIK